MVVINQYDENHDPHGLWTQTFTNLDMVLNDFPSSIVSRRVYVHGIIEGENIQLGYNKIYKHLYGND